MGPGDRFVESVGGDRLFIKVDDRLVEVGTRNSLSAGRFDKAAKISGGLIGATVFISLIFIFSRDLLAAPEYKNLSDFWKCFVFLGVTVQSAFFATVAWFIGGLVSIFVLCLWNFEWRKTWCALRCADQEEPKP